MTTQIDLEQFVTPEEAAAFLRCSPITVKRLARERKLPAHSVTNGLRKRWRFLISELASAGRIGTHRDDLAALAAVHGNRLRHLIAGFLNGWEFCTCAVRLGVPDLQLHILIPSKGGALGGNSTPPKPVFAAACCPWSFSRKRQSWPGNSPAIHYVESKVNAGVQRELQEQSASRQFGHVA